MSKKFIVGIIGIAVVVVMIAAAGTFALMSDNETSTANGAAAWTSALWTQTSQADFNAGTLNNVDTSSSPGNVTLPVNITSYPASGTSGNWTAGANAYSSDNAWSTFTPITNLITNSPSANSGTAWTNPSNANTSDTNNATITSGSSGNNVYGNYGFSLTGDAISKVRVGYSAFSAPGITFQGVGTVATAASGNVTPALPVGWDPNDIWLCFIVSLDNVTSTMPATWTSVIAGTNNGSGLRTTLFYRRAVAGDVAPLVTHSAGSGISAVILGYSGCITTGSPFGVNQAVLVKTPASTVNNFGAGVTTTTANDMIVLLSGTSGQTTSATYTGSPTPTEELDAPNAANYGQIIIADFIQAAAGATGARQSTLGTSRLNNGYQISLVPAPSITFQAGTAVPPTANGGNITPALPANWAANDIWLCLIVSWDNVNSTMPSGWTAVDAGTNNGTLLRTSLYWHRAVAVDSDPLIIHTGGSRITAAIVGYRGCVATGSPFDVNQAAALVKTPASTTNNFGNGMTTTVNNDMIVLLSGTNIRTTSATYTGSPVPVENYDLPNTSNYGEIIVASFLLPTAGPTGARSSIITSGLNNGYQLSLKPDEPQLTVHVSWDNGSTFPVQQATTLTSSKTTYYFDITSAIAWTNTLLDNSHFKVMVDAQTVGFPGTVSLDWLPVEVTYSDASVWNENYSTYTINLTGALLSKVEVGVEAHAASSERIQTQVSWDNGTTWSATQTTGALTTGDTTTWFDFTSATGWTPATLDNTRLQVRIWYLNSATWYLNGGVFGQVSLDYLPIRVTYINPLGTLTSQVFDTTLTGTRWDGCVWDSTIPANTTLTLTMRASDSAGTLLTLPFTSCGATPILSGLPPGRYIQWRATLTTTLVTAIPILSEVRSYYYHG